ncbi:MAG: serine hydrolase, partial [Janthinobacterium lividum]
LRLSDNVAGNKVLDSIGGPTGLTEYMRSIGDTVTRLDRREPELNEATPGDRRDTTTPAAIAKSLRRLVLGDALSTLSRQQLTAWLLADEVGGPLLRASLPKEWRIADRTGAGGHGSRGIVAVIWPPGQAPIVAAIFLTCTDATMDQRNGSIAELGAALVADVSKQNR